MRLTPPRTTPGSGTLEARRYISKGVAAFTLMAVLLGVTVLSAFALREDPTRTLAAAAPARSAPESGRSDGEIIATGRASYYGERFAGRPTANGEIFDPSAMTAAHRTLPFGSRVRVTNTSNDRAVVVRINDRGPYAGNRIIDLSRGAAEKIGMIHSGTAEVTLELLR